MKLSDEEIGILIRAGKISLEDIADEPEEAEEPEEPEDRP